MSAWHREHPELAGTDADPWMQHADYRRAFHCHRDLSTSGDSLIPPNTPAGGGSSSQGDTPVGISLARFQRAGAPCDNCGAPEDMPCQPFCQQEQIS